MLTLADLYLPDLRLARYTFAVQMKEPAQLPPHKGALLRGGFGMAFRRSVCVYPALPPCDGCLLKTRCPYPPIFEPAPPADSEVLRTHSDIPRPFVIVPPPDERTTYAVGDRLSFDLLLIGQAIESLPYFIVTFQRLGELGLGQARAQYTLEDVIHQDLRNGTTQPLLQSGVLQMDAPPVGIPASALAATGALPHPPTARSTVALTFQTPTALKHNDRIVEGAPPFHVLSRALLRRLSSLSYFYGGQQWAIDYRGWIDRAAAVEVVAAKIHWVSRSRYSTRQQQQTDLSGIVGSVTYRGDLAPFLPLLRLGALIHVGKGAVFGNGQYRLEVRNQ